MDYWTYVKDGTPKGWCNVLLCEFNKWPCIDKPFRKQYTQISFGMGVYTEGKWVVKDVDLEYCDVIAYHEIENDNLDSLVDKMQRDQ